MLKRFWLASWLGGFFLVVSLQGFTCGSVQQCMSDLDCSSGEACQAGACVKKTSPPSCTIAGQSLCGTVCVDLQNDSKNCSKCGGNCGAGHACKKGACVVIVPLCTSEADCKVGEFCNQGSCLTKCQSFPEICDGIDNNCNGQIDEGCSCPKGKIACNGQCIDQGLSCRCKPTESLCGDQCADLQNDMSHCGACNKRCGLGSSCVAGACKPVLPPCTSDADCKAGEFCNQGSCLAKCQPTAEICDGIDNNCDGQIDEGCTSELCKNHVPKYRVTGVELPTGLIRVLYTVEIMTQLPPTSFASEPKATLSTTDWMIEKVTFDPSKAQKVEIQVGFHQNFQGSATLTLEGTLLVEKSGLPTKELCPFQVKLPISACSASEICGDGLDNDCDGQIDNGCPCAPGKTDCKGQCVDLQDHGQHCGACGNVCSIHEFCQKGVCTFACPPGKSACFGACVDLQTENSHCGACGTRCGIGAQCVAGACKPVVPPCSTNADCAAGETCQNGVCVGGCTPTPEVCDGIDNNCNGQIDEGLSCRCQPTEILCGGQCVDLQTNAGNCGACGTRCGIGAQCVAGACKPVVPPCSTNADCAAGEICSSGVCKPSAPVCVSNADCPAGMICVNGHCF